MPRSCVRVLLLTLTSLAVGCTSSEPRQETPPVDREATPPVALPVQPPEDVSIELVETLERADTMRPGEAVVTLQAFLERHHGYTTDEMLVGEIERHRERADDLYHEARDRTRDGDYAEAESILRDLATHLPDTPIGEQAREHLNFRFYLIQAQQLLLKQRFGEAGEVAHRMLELDLTPSQAEQAERILDVVQHSTAALDVVERQSAEQATRQILVMLAQKMVEEGRYPSRLTLDELEKWDPFNGRSVQRALSRIEGYRPSGQSVSFTAVSRSGEQRVEVVDGEILSADTR